MFFCGGKGGKGGVRPGRHCAGAAFGREKYGILKIGRFWLICVCIAERVGSIVHAARDIYSSSLPLSSPSRGHLVSRGRKFGFFNVHVLYYILSEFLPAVKRGSGTAHN